VSNTRDRVVHGITLDKNVFPVQHVTIMAHVTGMVLDLAMALVYAMKAMPVIRALNALKAFSSTICSHYSVLHVTCHVSVTVDSEDPKGVKFVVTATFGRSHMAVLM
jgi:hypothetical protein